MEEKRNTFYAQNVIVISVHENKNTLLAEFVILILKRALFDYICDVTAFIQNIDGGNSLDNVLNAAPKFVRSMRMPLNRNDRIRYTGSTDEKILERAWRIGSNVIIVPTANAMSVTNSV